MADFLLGRLVTTAGLPLRITYQNFFSGRITTAVVHSKRSKSHKSPKTSVLSFIDNGNAKIPVKSVNAANVIKKLNFENQNLFGPILKSSPKRKLELQMGISYLDYKIPRRFKEAKFSKPKATTKVTVKECGYKNIAEEEYADAILLPMHEEIRETRTVTNGWDYDSMADSVLTELDKEVMVELPNQLHDLKAALKFPLINSFRKDGTDLNVTDQDYLNVEGDPVKYPSVTTILNKTMDSLSLERLKKWKESMIRKLGEDGFKKYQEQLFSQGKCLHRNVQDLLTGEPVESIHIDPANEGHWKSLQSIVPDIKHVQFLETKVIHPYLQYKGVVDCVAEYKDRLVVIDWKTSKKLKRKLSDTYDNPVQVAAYVGGINFDPSFHLQVKEALIVVAYEDGRPCQVHELGQIVCEQNWQRWLQRLKLYWEMLGQTGNISSSS